MTLAVQMRAFELWNGLVSWRWTPTVGLALGSVVYVLLAIAIIPDHIGAKSSPSSSDRPLSTTTNRHTLSSSATAAPANDASEASPVEDPDANRTQRRSSRRNLREEAASIAKRGFSPPLPRAEPPPPEPALTPEPPPPVVPPTPIEPPTSSTQRVEVSPATPEAPAPSATEQPASPAPSAAQ
jgi:hypothetical protein